jgi:dTDP-glucose 4,6-dehydratase
MRVFLTGGAGFIGRNFVERLLQETDIHVIVFDAFTYAVHPTTEGWLKSQPQVTLIKGDVRNQRQVEQAIMSTRPNRIVHMAAESHVDRSIKDPQIFFETNIGGTFNMLQATRAYLDKSGEIPKNFLYLQISTDEVYGSTEYEVDETAPYNPSSPYAASKAAADQLVNAWSRTYRIPVAITCSTNTFGPWQNSEKLIPKAIECTFAGVPVPIYGTGLQVRDWLYVEDHVIALLQILKRSVTGKFNLVGRSRDTNVELMKRIGRSIETNGQRSSKGRNLLKVEFVKDRAGHDQSYFLNGSKASEILSWKPQHDLTQGIEKTITWFINEHKIM